MAARVLLIDDLQFIRSLLKDILQTSGYIIAGEAENGKEGYELFVKKKPDIVLLDISMPVMDGLTSLSLMKRNYPDAKVVMCSALSEEDMILKAIHLGAQEYIVKPFKAERVLNALQKIAGKT